MHELGQVPIRIVDRADAAQPELFDETVVKRLVRASADRHANRGFGLPICFEPNVVLFRGYDARDMAGICPYAGFFGNNGSQDNSSPYPSSATEACGNQNLALPPAGAFSCGALLYYVTDMPTADTNAFLNAGMSLWIPTAGVSITQGMADPLRPDLANTPEFEPGLDSYHLPPSTVDPLDVVSCP